MGTLTVRMDQMKPWRSVTTELVTLILNSHARTDDVFKNYGSAILTMIVVMILTSQHICADREIVLLVRSIIDNVITII